MVDGNGKTPNVDVDGVTQPKKKKKDKDKKKADLDNLKKEVEMVRKDFGLHAVDSVIKLDSFKWFFI